MLLVFNGLVTDAPAGSAKRTMVDDLSEAFLVVEEVFVVLLRALDDEVDVL